MSCVRSIYILCLRDNPKVFITQALSLYLRRLQKAAFDRFLENKFKTGALQKIAVYQGCFPEVFYSSSIEGFVLSLLFGEKRHVPRFKLYRFHVASMWNTRGMFVAVFIGPYQTYMIIVCSYHVMYAFPSESTFYSCLNVK